jgi:predicted RNA-binding protein (virulence factor B family)
MPDRVTTQHSGPRPIDLYPGAIIVLKVADINKTGLFLEVGEDKQLLLPHNELHDRARIGDDVVVVVREDSMGRLYATNHITKNLDFEPWSLSIAQRVQALVYGHGERGWLCVVNGRHYGLLFHDRAHRTMRIGEELNVFVTHVSPDGKLDLDLLQPGVDPFRDAMPRLEDRLRREGFLALHDKSPPEHIRAELGMSKKAFKRALGALYRARKVTLEEGGVRWVGED